jgi:hypothetical protein
MNDYFVLFWNMTYKCYVFDKEPNPIKDILEMCPVFIFAFAVSDNLMTRQRFISQICTGIKKLIVIFQGNRGLSSEKKLKY